MCAGSSRYVQSQSACPAHHGWCLIAEDSPTSWTQDQVGNIFGLLCCIWIPPTPRSVVKFGFFHFLVFPPVSFRCSSFCSIFLTEVSLCLKLPVKLCCIWFRCIPSIITVETGSQCCVMHIATQQHSHKQQSLINEIDVPVPEKGLSLICNSICHFFLSQPCSVIVEVSGLQ